MRARVVLTLVLALLLASCGEDDGFFSTLSTGAVTTSAGSETAGGQVTTTIGATTTAAQATTTTAPPAQAVWARVPQDEAVFGGADWQVMWGVDLGGPGVIGLGYDWSGGDGDAAVWTSPDGLAWSRVPHDEAVFGGAGTQVVYALAPTPAGLVAVGYDSSGGDGNGAVWTSPDGLAWSRVPHDEAVFGGADDQEIWDVSIGGPGLVAVGFDASGGDPDAAVWISADGLAWTRVPHDEVILGGGGDQWMYVVVAGGPGLVGVGTDGSGGDWDAAVWTSTDGITWTRVPHDEAVFGGNDDQEMWDAWAGGPGLVAVGRDYSGGDSDAAVWISPDGLAWSRAPHDEVVFGGVGRQHMAAIVATGSNLVVVGLDETAEGDADAVVWVSPDGLTWSRVPHDEVVFGGDGGQEMEGVVLLGQTLVVVGSEKTGDDYDAAVWVGPSPG